MSVRLSEDELKRLKALAKVSCPRAAPGAEAFGAYPRTLTLPANPFLP